MLALLKEEGIANHRSGIVFNGEEAFGKDALSEVYSVFWDNLFPIISRAHLTLHFLSLQPLPFVALQHSNLNKLGHFHCRYQKP